MGKTRSKLDKGFLNINLDKLVKADWNYKEEDNKLTQKLINNIKRNGQIENLIIRELDSGYYEVVNGNHRLDVMNTLEIKEAHAYNFGKISLTQAQRIAIETNETRFSTDQVKLSELIAEMSEDFTNEDLLETLPFSQQELINFKQLLDFNWEDYDTENEMLNQADFNLKITITVNQDILDRWNELKERFNGVIGYDNESKVFEFAIIEALNIPKESIQ